MGIVHRFFLKVNDHPRLKWKVEWIEKEYLLNWKKGEQMSKKGVQNGQKERINSKDKLSIWRCWAKRQENTNNERKDGVSKGKCA